MMNILFAKELLDFLCNELWSIVADQGDGTTILGGKCSLSTLITVPSQCFVCYIYIFVIVSPHVPLMEPES